MRLSGLKKRYPENDEVAFQRVQKELKVIDQLEFSGYFLITWDIVRYSSSLGLLHIGRGSGANSIIAYCLGITDICPIELDLYFERFLNLNRKTPPDFDIDFCMRRRDVVVNYVREKYGHDNVANIMVAQLLFLDADDPEREIHMYINSPGGSVYAGLAIYDTMQHLRAPVATYCVGFAASMGAVLLAGGEEGRRHALPNSRIMIHQPSSGTQGTAADIEIAAREVLDIRERLNRILAKHTNKTPEEIARDVDRDRFMGAHEAAEYGLIDRVLEGPLASGGKPATSERLEEGNEEARTILMRHGGSDGDVERMIALVREHDADERTRQLIAEETDAALAELSVFPESAARRALAGLVEHERTRLR